MKSHRQRIKEELLGVGVTWYGLKKFAIKYLPNIINEKEHIKGVVYGRYKDKYGGPPFNEGLLVATDLRIIFVDHKPGYTKINELNYDIVSGVDITSAGFSSITLHTLHPKLGDTTIRFANSRCARIFVNYVEDRRIKDALK